MSDNEPIRYSLEDGIATITIDRPARKNALSVEAMNGLTNAWERVERDSQARVVILTSADCGVFSAGLDLRQAAEIRARDGVDILTLMRDPMQTAMRTVSKPIIAAMTGSLMAGGMLLALKCDLRIGLRGTRAGITEVKMGRGSPWAVPLLWMLPQPVVMELGAGAHAWRGTCRSSGSRSMVSSIIWKKHPTLFVRVHCNLRARL